MSDVTPARPAGAADHRPDLRGRVRRASVVAGFVCLMIIPNGAAAQETLTPIADYLARSAPVLTQEPVEPSHRARADVALALTSMVMIGIATGATVSCYMPESGCKEANPIMGWAINGSVVRAAVIKPIIGGGLLYVVWRFLPEGKLKTVTLGILAGLNGWDAVHDIRVVGRIRR